MNFSRWRISRQIGALSLLLAITVLTGLSLLTYQLSSQALRSALAESMQDRLSTIESLVDLEYLDQSESQRQYADLLEEFYPEPFQRLSTRIIANGISAPELRSGDTLFNGNRDALDLYAEIIEGTASVYVRDKGQFVRIAQSTDDGGTILDNETAISPQHKVFPQVKEGQLQVVSELQSNRLYATLYQPLYDANRQVVGVLKLTTDHSDFIDRLVKILSAIQIGDNGYFSLIDEHSGRFIYHPRMDDIPLAKDMLDDAGQGRYQHALSEGRRNIRVLMVNGENWLQSGVEVDSAHWVLAASAPETELESDLMVLKNTSILMSIGGCMIIGMLIPLILSRTLNHPLEQLCARIDAVGQGDLSQHHQTVPEDSSNEMHRITASVDTMSRQLRNLMAELGHSTEALEHAASDLQDLAQRNGTGTSELKRQTDQIATAMEEMSCTAREVASHASESAGYSQQMDNTADEGDKEVDAVIQQMTNLAHSLKEGSQSIDRVASESQAIAKVVQVIDEIAEQTNLLALNAAIEAARAGDQGRGFAVVADEVRQLAQRTQHSTTEIGETIEQLHKRTQDAVAQMGSSLTMSQRSTEQSNAAGAALKAITAGIGQLSSSANTIASAAEEQEVVAGDIAANLTQITDLVRLSEEDAGQTVEASEALAKLAGNLRQHLSRFRL
ncbi:methyl-accepting chemotaxis protein [Marinobacter hydrocarbonoclasticus]|nr:methyl-accepting chemotaxis protein [Marinobacter nauticus]